jgi:hypothetical protein
LQPFNLTLWLSDSISATPVNKSCNGQASTSVSQTDSSQGGDNEIDNCDQSPALGLGRPVKVAHSSLLAAMSLAVASLGLGTYLAALDVAWSRPGVGPSVIGPQAYTARDEMGRPTCRRNNFGDPQRPLVRIGQNCP